jgi:hypothetical protein
VSPQALLRQIHRLTPVGGEMVTTAGQEVRDQL